MQTHAYMYTLFILCFMLYHICYELSFFQLDYRLLDRIDWDVQQGTMKGAGLGF